MYIHNVIFLKALSLYFIWKKISTCLKLLHHFYATELKWKNVKAGKMVICEKRSSCMVGWCSVIYKWCLGHQIIILLHRINIWIFFKIKKPIYFDIYKWFRDLRVIEPYWWMGKLKALSSCLLKLCWFSKKKKEEKTNKQKQPNKQKSKQLKQNPNKNKQTK